mgnify:CR=1 FL=1
MFFFVEKLNLRMASEYRYVNQSDCLAIHGVDDAQKFHMLMVSLLLLVFVILVHIPYSISFCLRIPIVVFLFLQDALDIIQISKEDQEHTFRMLAAVLWLGNISFQVIDNENHVDV